MTVEALRKSVLGVLRQPRVFPEGADVNGNCIERRNAHLAAAAERPSEDPVLLGTTENLDSAGGWIHEPQPWDALLAIDVLFSRAIHDGCRGRQDFTYPVGRQREPGGFWKGRHSLATPAGQVRDKYLGAKVKLGFIKDDPATRATPPTAERSTDFDTEGRTRECMFRSRTRRDNQFSIDDFADHILWQPKDVFVASWAYFRGPVWHRFEVYPKSDSATPQHEVIAASMR